MGTKILLADDHEIVRDGLRSLLERQSHMEVVGEAKNGKETLRHVKELKPDIVIMDVTMPDLGGIEATQRIHVDCPNVKVIALSMHSDPQLVAEMLKSGASGYLLKDCAFAELAHAIDVVTEGQVYLSPAIAGSLVNNYFCHVSDRSGNGSVYLTQRERQVLQLLAEGKTTKEIALSLYVSRKTIETHKRKIMNKLNINSIAELTKYAIRHGLTSLT